MSLKYKCKLCGEKILDVPSCEWHQDYYHRIINNVGLINWLFEEQEEEGRGK